MKFKLLFSTNEGSLRYDSFYKALRELGVIINGDMIEFDDIDLIDRITDIAKECGVRVIVTRIE